jgi:4-hydroxythreonine-4-phosphate dehydrogenase
MLSAQAGDAAARYVIRACALAQAGEIDGIVTAPLNKEAMQAGGHHWPGHTELLAHQFGVDRYSLVLSAGDLYFFHLTTCRLKAIDTLTSERVIDGLRLADGFLRARPIRRRLRWRA